MYKRQPESRAKKFGEVIGGLHDLILFGLKGSASYADHAQILNKRSDEIYGGFHAFLNFLSKESFTEEELLGKAIEAGHFNLKVMELLDAANTDAYGHPEPSKARVTPVKGKAIVCLLYTSVSAETIKSGTVLTYANYRLIKGGKSPKNAPTFVFNKA